MRPSVLIGVTVAGESANQRKKTDDHLLINLEKILHAQLVVVDTVLLHGRRNLAQCFGSIGLSKFMFIWIFEIIHTNTVLRCGIMIEDPLWDKKNIYTDIQGVAGLLTD